jgi:hypothetical protein
MGLRLIFRPLDRPSAHHRALAKGPRFNPACVEAYLLPSTQLRTRFGLDCRDCEFVSAEAALTAGALGCGVLCRLHGETSNPFQVPGHLAW